MTILRKQFRESVDRFTEEKKKPGKWKRESSVARKWSGIFFHFEMWNWFRHLQCTIQGEVISSFRSLFLLFLCFKGVFFSMSGLIRQTLQSHYWNLFYFIFWDVLFSHCFSSSSILLITRNIDYEKSGYFCAQNMRPKPYESFTLMQGRKLFLFFFRKSSGCFYIHFLKFYHLHFLSLLKRYMTSKHLTIFFMFIIFLRKLMNQPENKTFSK